MPKALFLARPTAIAEQFNLWRRRNPALASLSVAIVLLMLAMFAGEDEAPVRAASYLRGWVETGMLTKA